MLRAIWPTAAVIWRSSKSRSKASSGARSRGRRAGHGADFGVRPVSGPDGVAWAQKLAQREGIVTGISGGASFAVAMQVAERAEPGSVILCMLPDTGERYMSTPLFASIPEEMTPEEAALSRSTPGYQLG